MGERRMRMSPVELRERFYDLPPLSNTQLKTLWGQHRNSLRNHVATENAFDFLDWSTIQATMFVGDFEMTQKELFQIRMHPRAAVYELALREYNFGNPSRMEGAQYTSGNRVHQVYHLMQWERTTGKQIEDMEHIVEFGGGYGAMASIVYKMGFEGKYWIYDFPELLILQEFYLSNIGLAWRQDLHLVDADNFGIEYDDWYIKPDLFIALHSLSETPLDQRDAFVKFTTPVSALFTYQKSFEDMNNEKWFANYLSEHTEFFAANFPSQYHDKIIYLICDQKWVRNG